MDDPYEHHVAASSYHVADIGRTLGETILAWRARRGWSQRGLEQVSGVNQSTISRLERGLSGGMRLVTLGRLAWALNAEEAVLLALAPYGEEAIRSDIKDGYGPTTEERERAIARARPIAALPPDHAGRTHPYAGRSASTAADQLQADAVNGIKK